LYRKLLSKNVVMVLAMVFIAFLTSGGVYILTSMPGAVVSTGTGTGFMARSSTSQTTTEFFAVLFLTLAGSAGLILLEGALRSSFDLSGSKIRYIAALGLFGLSIALMEFLIWAKYG